MAKITYRFFNNLDPSLLQYASGVKYELCFTNDTVTTDNKIMQEVRKSNVKLEELYFCIKCDPRAFLAIIHRIDIYLLSSGKELGWSMSSECCNWAVIDDTDIIEINTYIV